MKEISRDQGDVGLWLATSAASEMQAPLTRLVAALHDDAVGGEGRQVAEELQLAEGLASLVRGVADLAVETGWRGPVDVHEAIEVALQLTWHEVATRARLSRRYNAIPHARGHLPTLVRALAGLLRNAGQAIPEGVPGANHISVHTGLQPDGAFIDVIDSGVGIEPTDMHRIFDPFFTTKGASGLGLTSARAGIEGLGGTLTAKSRAGYGSRFSISLPADGPVAGSALPGAPLEVMPLRRVLVVASTLARARALGRAVESEDTSVTLARNDEALERLGFGEAFELIAWEAESWLSGGYRERLAGVAPDALSRTYALRPVPRLDAVPR